MDQIVAEVRALVEACDAPFPENTPNNRGKHWYSIFGHDRQNKQVCHDLMSLSPVDLWCQRPEIAAFQKRNAHVMQRFFSEGTIFDRLR